MRIVRLSVDPEVLLLYDFVSEGEAQSLLAEANSRFERSSTVCDDPSGGCTVEERTSSSATLPRNPMTEGIQDRGKAFARLPVAEALQIVRYEPGQEYKPHLDAFDASSGGARALEMYDGRQRDATVLIYLDKPEVGGETVFPEIGLRIAPIPRAALFWHNIRPDGAIEGRTLHGGAPVQRGVKHAVNLWLRGPVRDPVYAYALSEDVSPPTETTDRRSAIVTCGVGVGIGALIGGPPGALIGGALGWTADALRRRFTS